MKILNWFKSKETKDQNSIEYICRKYGIENYIINDDETVDVDGDVNLYKKGLTKLPIKFGKVTGYFFCGHNHLTSLEGSPYYVGGYFACNYNNKLVNFKGFPEDYTGDVNFMDNPVYELLENISRENWQKMIDLCNEYDAIKDNGDIIEDRIHEIYLEIGYSEKKVSKLMIKRNVCPECFSKLEHEEEGDFLYFRYESNIEHYNKCLGFTEDYYE